MNTLTDSRSFLSGVSFDNESYLDQLKTVDNTIIDMCSIVDVFEQQYKYFTCDELFIEYFVVVIPNSFQ